jgi:GGDEF domain-containing protein
LDEFLEAMAETAATTLVSDRARALRTTRAGSDRLTGLPDAQAFSELTGREVERVRRHRRPLALVLVDVDGFRRVNDAHGRAGGDAVLREPADRLRAHVRGHDHLGRIGGDEFAWLLPRPTSGRPATPPPGCAGRRPRRPSRPPAT